MKSMNKLNEKSNAKVLRRIVRQSFVSMLCILSLSSLYGQNCTGCTDPEATVYALAASCTNGVPNGDAYLQISEIVVGDRVNWSMGSTYTGDPSYANATDVSAATFPYIVTNNLANPSGSQDYTLRVFVNCPTGNCYVDYTVTLFEQDCTVGCNCAEMVFLNEPLNSSTLKFSVDPSVVPLNEIYGPDGVGHWYPGTGTSEMPSPHGLATDNNGSLYIAETGSNSNIRKFDCAGNIEPVTSTTIFDPDAHVNMFAIGNTLYTNNSGQLKAFDLCTGTELGQACLNQMGLYQWGISYNPTTELVYVSVSSGWDVQSVWVFTRTELENSIANGTCIDPLIPPGTSPVVNVGDNFFPTGNSGAMGIAGDNDGNIYIAMDANGASKIMKYDSNGNYLGESTSNARITFVQGLVWSEDSNRIYVASYTDDANYDCIAAYDANNLSYLGTAAPNPNSAVTNNTAKTLAIVDECCPTNTTMTVEATLCDANVGDVLFLHELINCDGTICEGTWDVGAGNTGLTYDACGHTVTVDAMGACGTFTLGSDGLGNPQCGAFAVTVNIDVLTAPTVTITGDQSLCPGDTPTDLVATASSGTVDYQWQMSSVSCTGPWTDISAATSSTYTPPVPTADTYYQVVVMESGNCSNGSCDAESNCVTVSPGSNCCPSDNCGGILVTPN